ncbi:MAG: hypothetical protein ACR2NO_08920 [Chloroflexota bacterium]
MVAIDAMGAPVRVSGAALAGGPLVALSPGRRLQDLARVDQGGRGSFPSAFGRASGAAPLSAASRTAGPLALQPETLPVRWGIPSFFAGATFGPPYEMENRTAEWALSAQAMQTYSPLDRQARMAQRVHPRGPALQTGAPFLAALYGTTPAPPSLGVGVDFLR